MERNMNETLKKILGEGVLNGWKNDVIALYENSSDERFLNDNQDCAKFLIDVMIGTAQKKVLIYSGKLEQKFYENAIKHSSATDINILVDDESNAHWTSKYPNVSVTKIGQTPDINNHFFVADDKSYRYERDNDLGTALACFNAPESAQALTNRFNAYQG